jgi:hypothetical protein
MLQLKTKEKDTSLIKCLIATDNVHVCVGKIVFNVYALHCSILDMYDYKLYIFFIKYMLYYLIFKHGLIRRHIVVLKLI